MTDNQSCDMNTIAKIEFDVQITCDSCSEAVQKELGKLKGIESVTIDVQKQSVIVETVLPSQSILQAIENTGRRAVLKGYGSKEGRAGLGSAVAEISNNSGVVGVVRFFQANEKVCVIDGTIDGLTEGEHGLHIHEYGDLSDGCKKLGDHFNPTKSKHGGPFDKERHYGDLGNITADKDRRALFRTEDKVVKVWDIIGRSLAVTSERDDLGQGNSKTSKSDGNSGNILACAIIARSAGLFQNPKRICKCDGVSVWDERDKPSAGESRSSN